MDSLAQTPKQLVKCALCGARISPDKHVVGIGYVGPDCYHKVSALAEFLEKHNMVDAVEGGLVISHDELNSRAKELNLLTIKLQKAGLAVHSSKASNGIRISIFADSKRQFVRSAKRFAQQMAVAA